MSEQARIVRKGPFAIEIEAGKSYAWCACGRSGNQPFCDGSHKDTGFSPVVHKPQVGGKAHFCGCKQTSNPPFCDGTHARL